MAIATSTAIAIGGLAISAGTTAMSFSQASQQKKASERATREADKKMAEARARLEVNYAESMSVKKEPYELQREAELAGTAQLIDVGQESERGAQTTAGKVLALQQQGQGNIRSAMGDELSDVEGMIIEEASRNRDVNVQLDLGEVAGKQREAAEAKARAEKAKAEGWQGVVNTVQKSFPLIETFGKNGTHNSQLADLTGASTAPMSSNMTMAQKYPNLYGNQNLNTGTFGQQINSFQMPTFQPLNYNLNRKGFAPQPVSLFGQQPYNPFYYGN